MFGWWIGWWIALYVLIGGCLVFVEDVPQSMSPFEQIIRIILWPSWLAATVARAILTWFLEK